MNFFMAVDEAIGSNYSQLYDNERNSVDVYIGNMRLVCAKHCIGFVHVDECQHLLRNMKAKHSASVSDLESLFNRIGIPMLMTCTPEGMSLFFDTGTDKVQQQLMITRRLMSERVWPYNPMTFGSDTFKEFINAFLPDNIFKSTGVKTDEFRAKIHELTFGIHAVAARLLRLFFEVVVSRKGELDDGKGIQILEKVYSQHFDKVSHVIQNLRNEKSQAQEIAKQKSKGKSVSSKVKKMKSATLHSSRVAPRMASENSIQGLKKEEHPRSASAEYEGLHTGFFDIHQ